MVQPADTSDSMQLASASATPLESLATAGTSVTTVATTPHATVVELLPDARGQGLENDTGRHGTETVPQPSRLLSQQAIDRLPVSSVPASASPVTPARTHQHAPVVESEQARQTVAQLGALVTEAASTLVLEDRRWRSAHRTQLRQHDDLVRFARFLAELATHAGLPFTDPPAYAERLATDLSEWQSITWGHVQAHMAWMLDRGYAVGTIDNALSTLKVYARLAQRAGALAAEDLTRILDLHPFGYRGGLIVDDQRPADKRRRPGAKKGQPTAITPEEAQVLKNAHPDNPRGRRDALLLTLLIDHGLRVGEVVALQLEDIEGLEGTTEGIDDGRKVLQGQEGLDETIGPIERTQYALNALPTDEPSGAGRVAGQAPLRRSRTAQTIATRFARATPSTVLLRVRRPKVKKEQRHALTPDCVSALRRYLEVRRLVEPATIGPLLCATQPHNPALVVAGMTENGIHKRVKSLGRELLGVDDLGPHDLRHFWATSAARGKTPFDRLVRAGGWNSPAMPLRYIDAEEVANTGVVLDHLRQATVAPQHLPRHDPPQQ